MEMVNNFSGSCIEIENRKSCRIPQVKPDCVRCLSVFSVSFNTKLL